MQEKRNVGTQSRLIRHVCRNHSDKHKGIRLLTDVRLDPGSSSAYQSAIPIDNHFRVDNNNSMSYQYCRQSEMLFDGTDSTIGGSFSMLLIDALKT